MRGIGRLLFETVSRLGKGRMGRRGSRRRYGSVTRAPSGAVGASKLARLTATNGRVAGAGAVGAAVE